ncbi:hypothetical protein ABZY19_39880 [Streptomyces sp. NPDC006475]
MTANAQHTTVMDRQRERSQLNPAAKVTQDASPITVPDGPQR